MVWLTEDLINGNDKWISLNIRFLLNESYTKRVWV